jgi:hypothetical protein
VIFGGYFDIFNEISRMSSGGESSLPDFDLIERTIIDSLGGRFSVSDGLHVYNG